MPLKVLTDRMWPCSELDLLTTKSDQLIFVPTAPSHTFGEVPTSIFKDTTLTD